MALVKIVGALLLGKYMYWALSSLPSRYSVGFRGGFSVTDEWEPLVGASIAASR